MAPSVTFLLLTYNHERYVREAVLAAFAQDYHPLQIVISDDASPDKTYNRIMEEVRRYRGPHEVCVNRNVRRLRSVEHLTHVMSMVKGDFVVMAHGDDISLPNRTSNLVSTWQDQRVSMVSSNAQYIDRRGDRFKMTCRDAISRRITGEEIIKQTWIWEMLGATLAFEPEVVTKFEPLTAMSLATGLDCVLPMRAALLKGFHFNAEPLVLYRRHNSNMSNFTVDRTTSLLAYDETKMGEFAASRIRMLDDLRVLEVGQCENSALKKIRVQLQAQLLRDVRRWCRLRAELRANAQLPTWIAEKKMLARRTRPELSIWFGKERLIVRANRWFRKVLPRRPDSSAH
jgi:glycosyltransferase involved in cell wall biosynthesis